MQYTVLVRSQFAGTSWRPTKWGPRYPNPVEASNVVAAIEQFVDRGDGYFGPRPPHEDGTMENPITFNGGASEICAVQTEVYSGLQSITESQMKKPMNPKKVPKKGKKGKAPSKRPC
jgi:hypothetical protein